MPKTLGIVMAFFKFKSYRVPKGPSNTDYRWATIIVTFLAYRLQVFAEIYFKRYMQFFR